MLHWHNKQGLVQKQLGLEIYWFRYTGGRGGKSTYILGEVYADVDRAVEKVGGKLICAQAIGLPMFRISFQEPSRSPSMQTNISSLGISFGGKREKSRTV